MRRAAAWASVAVVAFSGAPAAAQSSLAGATLQVTRATGSIKIDGDLGDEGWRGATRVTTWYEINPGENNEPPVRNVALLTYDDRSFYIAFELDDPDPAAIRAPLGDHDALSGNSMDFAGVLLDPLNTGRNGVEFFVTPRNVQYDAVIDDQSGENSSPDFFWDSAARIGAHGWTAEIRIPFSSLRYRNADPQTWGIILYRNYPRNFRYQFFTTRVPKNNNCLVCYENRMDGLERLPPGGHLVAAPYVSGTAASRARDDTAGEPLIRDPLKGRVGLDVKFTPSANTAIDATLRPDFSQVESDTAQISANERFALFYPEKRPFFLEGVDLLQTPFQALYTRTITSPDWGGRVTGKAGGIRYTALAAADAGGGTVILPGPNDSTTADQPSASDVFVVRAQKMIGLSFIGALVADREGRDGGWHNRVAGPDFQWRPSGADVVTGQWLISQSRTPDRPDLADEWTGRRLSGGAAQASWNHNTRHLDWAAKYADVGTGFRADTGFMPQVGYREGYAQAGWQIYPSGFLRRERTFLNVDYQVDQTGALITRDVEPGLGMDILWNGFMQYRYIDARTRAGTRVIQRHQLGFIANFSPTRHFSYIGVDGTVGRDIDFDNARPARGATVNISATLQPSDHLALNLLQNTRWLNVDEGPFAAGRLFTQRVSRVKATYTFTSRLFVRAIGQYILTTREPQLFVDVVDARAGDFTGSLLFAYKINWQSVMFVGYGDDRSLADQRTLEPLDQQIFVKMSYAFQR